VAGGLPPRRHANRLPLNQRRWLARTLIRKQSGLRGKIINAPSGAAWLSDAEFPAHLPPPEPIMKVLSFFAAVSLIAGCTSLRPIDGSPAELRQRIAAGELLKTGDRILITTSDAKTHRLTVSSIDAELIQGRSESFPVAQVTAVKKRQFSRAKTTALAIGIALAGTVIGLGAYAASHLSFAL
jgi:hypothetical protein